jgi:predicted RNA methylase
MVTHDFDALIRKSHDYLYANSEIKTPEALQSEVAKLVMVLVAQSRGLLPFELRATESQAHWAEESYEFLRVSKPEWDWGPIELDASSVDWVLKTLADVDFRYAERDFLGDALEAMRSTDAKRLGGQFFTDQRITELALRLLSYDPVQHDFLDVCAGTGGFLIPAVKISSSAQTSKAVLGVEIDAKIGRLATSTISHFDFHETSRVFQADSLKAPEFWSVEMRKSIVPGTHARLASNPPFGTKIKIRDENILDQYELARQWRFDGKSWSSDRKTTARAPELLFIERNLQLAIPGEGVVGLVLPYQILSGPQLGYIRQWLLSNAAIVAIVDLPADTFQPWTGTKTSLVIFRRRERPLLDVDEIRDDPEIFMSIAENIGHDRRGKPVFGDNGKIVEDLTAIGDAFEQFRNGEDFQGVHDGSFVLDPKAILRSSDNRLNAAHYRPEDSGVLRNFANISDGTFTSRPLGELVERVFCPGRFKRNYVESDGVPFLGGSNISQFSITTNKALSKDDPRLEELKVRTNWILVTRSGSTGIVSRVPMSWDGFAISEHVIRIVPKKGMESEADFVETFLRSDWGQQLLAMGVFGSVIDEITPDFISELPIPLPCDLSRITELSRHAASVTRAREVAAQGLANAQKELAGLLSSLVSP